MKAQLELYEFVKELFDGYGHIGQLVFDETYAPLEEHARENPDFVLPKKVKCDDYLIRNIPPPAPNQLFLNLLRKKLPSAPTTAEKPRVFKFGRRKFSSPAKIPEIFRFGDCPPVGGTSFPLPKAKKSRILRFEDDEYPEEWDEMLKK